MLKWVRYFFEIGIPLLKINSFAKKAIKKDIPISQSMAYYKKLIKKHAPNHLRVEIIENGKENIPEGQTFLVGNHTSNIDAILMIMLSDRGLTFLAKKEIINFPVVGHLVTSAKSCYLDREDLRSEIKAIQQSIKVMEDNPDISYLAYPEGTRSHGPDYQFGQYHSGTFKIATKLNLPIVPFAMFNPGKVLDQHYHYKKYPVQVTYCTPIMPEQYQDMTTKEIADLAHKEVEEALNQMREKDRELVQKLNKYSDKKMEKVYRIEKACKKY